MSEHLAMGTFGTATAILAVCCNLLYYGNGHRLKHSGIDMAKLEVCIKELQRPDLKVEVWMQNTDCWKCPLLRVASVPAVAANCTQLIHLHANHTTAIHLVLNSAAEHEQLCRFEKAVLEAAFYQILVSSPDSESSNSGGDSSIASCSFITVKAGRDNSLPILYAFVTVVGVALLWCGLKLMYRRHIFDRCLKPFGIREAETLVHADLGSTNSQSCDIPTNQKKPVRLRSLDTFRGLSLTVMIFVNYGGGQYWFFQHSAWNGLTVADLVFPWFVFVMGTAMAIVFSSGHRKGRSKREMFGQILLRTIKLFILGLMVNSSSSGNKLANLRIPGVLQRFAISYLVVALTEMIFSGGYIKQLHVPVMTWRQKLGDIIFFCPNLIIALLMITIHIVVTFAVPYDMDGCPTGYVGPGGISEGTADHLPYQNCTGGIARYIDRKVFGLEHIYNHPSCTRLYHCSGHDPEGVLGTLTSIFICFLGVQAGRILTCFSSPKDRIIRWCIWALGLGVIAIILTKGSQNEGWIPINKNLWSATFVIALGAMANLLLAFLYLMIDVLKLWSGAPFYYPGMNSIFVYVGSEIMEDLIPVSFAVSVKYQTHLTALFLNLWSTAFWVLVAMYMFYKNIFISV